MIVRVNKDTQLKLNALGFEIAHYDYYGDTDIDIYLPNEFDIDKVEDACNAMLNILGIENIECQHDGMDETGQYFNCVRNIPEHLLEYPNRIIQ